jgi:hypothetical protein
MMALRAIPKHNRRNIAVKRHLPGRCGGLPC